MRKYIMLIILLLVVLTGCSINPYKGGAIEYLDSLEPSIVYLCQVFRPLFVELS